jgi:hypothetical protein
VGSAESECKIEIGVKAFEILINIELNGISIYTYIIYTYIIYTYIIYTSTIHIYRVKRRLVN